MEIPMYMLEIGKLYRCEEYFLMLYPDCETAAGPALAGAPVHERSGRLIGRNVAEAAAAYWSNRSGKPVSFLEKNMPLLVLSFKGKGKYIEVLAGDKKGWIVNPYCEIRYLLEEIG